MKRVYLHIGQTKTGSTSLQAFLHHNRAALSRLGVVYPQVPADDPHPAQHRCLVQALHSGDDALEPAICTWQFVLAQIESSAADAAVISEEMLWHLWEAHPHRREAALDWIAERLAPFDVRIVCYLRPQHEWIESWFNQIARTVVDGSSQMGFGEFQAHAQQLGSFDYLRRTADWAARFGESRLIVRPYEPAHTPIDVIDDFCDLIGLDAGRRAGLHRPDGLQQRLSMPACALSTHFNRHPAAAAFKRPFLDAVVSHAAEGGDRRRHWLSPEQALTLQAACEPGNSELARRFLGRDHLFVQPMPRFAAEDVFAGLTVDDLAGLAVHLFIAQQRHIRQLRKAVALLRSPAAGSPPAAAPEHDDRDTDFT